MKIRKDDIDAKVQKAAKRRASLSTNIYKPSFELKQKKKGQGLRPAPMGLHQPRATFIRERKMPMPTGTRLAARQNSRIG